MNSKVDQIKNHCHGCVIYNNECDTQKNNFDGSCPCSQCIIKTMCENSCERYDIYRKIKELDERR